MYGRRTQRESRLRLIMLMPMSGGGRQTELRGAIAGKGGQGLGVGDCSPREMLPTSIVRMFSRKARDAEQTLPAPMRRRELAAVDTAVRQPPLVRRAAVGL